MNNKVVPRVLLAVVLATLGPAAGAAQYLVIGSGGPEYTTPQETVEALEEELLPTFDALMKLEAAKKIVGGGMPVGDRSFAFILEAASNDEADRLLRDLPAWGLLKWDIKPLQSFQARAEKERSIVDTLMKKVTEPAPDPVPAQTPPAPAAAPAPMPPNPPAQLAPLTPPPPPAAPAQVEAAIAL
ncbi:hypothetical protein [Pseudogulbenkiania sp. MAI-1]|uniref:hypothetical protein n=1 Tax=Pseudogulbenkiania sp. MAI-1 TaxID=990370 RepID=UPI00045E9137|nr:hypothetical protein [Pseudogulbenkiania sp. MAI-1]